MIIVISRMFIHYNIFKLCSNFVMTLPMQKYYLISFSHACKIMNAHDHSLTYASAYIFEGDIFVFYCISEKLPLEYGNHPLH